MLDGTGRTLPAAFRKPMDVNAQRERCPYTYMCVYIYVYIHVSTYMYLHVYTHWARGRPFGGRGALRGAAGPGFKRGPEDAGGRRERSPVPGREGSPRHRAGASLPALPAAQALSASPLCRRGCSSTASGHCSVFPLFQAVRCLSSLIK